jgi:hypothetical protein
MAGLALLAAPTAGHAQELAASLAGTPGTWDRLPGVMDVRFEGARTLGDQVRAGGATLDLPGLTWVRGTPVDGLTIGAGWVSFRPHVPRRLNLDGTEAPPSDVGTAWPRVDVLSGAGILVPDEASVLALVSGDGIAIRWSPLSTPAGAAIVELLVDPAGNLTVQYLHVPSELARMLDAGQVRGPDAKVHPMSASSYRQRELRVPIEALPMHDPSMPKSTDPLPPNCGPEAGTWCDRADGAGVSEIYLNEDFNDGLSASRGWSGTDMWHEIPFAICAPGASSNPGRSWYFGDDTVCQYRLNAGGGLFAPAVGPITPGTGLNFQFRLGLGNAGDLAEIYVNGGLFLTMPAIPDPTLWYHFTFPLDMSAYAGQVVQIEFRLTSDLTQQALGWMVDDVQVFNSGSANVPCVINAGKNGNAACGDRVNTEWTFFENNFCQGCTYTFYVLVECGREMHIPLDDMEGADIKVTSMATGQPVPLHCVNQTALADAGLGAYRGLVLDCCALPAGPETWWGPAFDVIDNAGPGHVSWGFGMPRCGSILEYDAACGNNDSGVTCDEIDGAFGCGGCGGLLPLLGPGESQTVDCYISDPNGLCGLYRVDITSGGNLWNLFANCDGTNTPRFIIFHDCAEAWAAYNPLPELFIANLTTANGCPALQVDFDVQNLGCKDHLGDVLVRLSSNCVPPETQDFLVTGPVAVGQSIHVTVPFTVACSPVRVQVDADPDNTIEECTENPTIVSCRADRGVDSLATFTCGCTAQLVADAGADVAGCPGDRFVLDGSASSIVPCANPQYQWTNGAGVIVSPWSSSPTYNAQVAQCPGGEAYTMEVRCLGEPCTEPDTVRVDCMVVTPDAGPDVKACVGDPVMLDGSASTVSNCPDREFRWFDRLGNEVRGWSPDPTVDLGGLVCANAGDYQLEVRCVGSTCSDVDEVLIQCVDVRAFGGPDVHTCDGDTFNITQASSLRTNCTQSSYQWFDALGNALTVPSASPDYTGSMSGCPVTKTLTLVASCTDAGFTTCSGSDDVDVICTKPQVPVPLTNVRCARTADIACGVSEAGVTYSWDTDTSIDANGDGDPANDADATRCIVTRYAWPTEGTRTVRAWARDANGCTSFADIDVEVFDDPIVPTPTAVPACEGAASLLSCGVAPPEAGVTYSWDQDVAVDSSGNGVPGDDADGTGCDVPFVYATAGAYTAKVTATDGRGCFSSATVVVDVPGATPPPEVVGERVSKAGGLTITWPALAGASTYRVARGAIGTWFSHGVDPAAGRGSCDTVGTTFTDADDGSDGNDWYYIVTAVNPCGIEGPQGTGFDSVNPTPRDPPSPACP